MIHVITWMNLKRIMLSERSQTPKTTYCMPKFVIYMTFQRKQYYSDEKQISGFWGAEVRERN